MVIYTPSADCIPLPASYLNDGIVLDVEVADGKDWTVLLPPENAWGRCRIVASRATGRTELKAVVSDSITLIVNRTPVTCTRIRTLHPYTVLDIIGIGTGWIVRCDMDVDFFLR